MTGAFVGASEVGARLGVSRQWVYQLSKRPDWPVPCGELHSGRVWMTKDIESWIAEHRPAHARGQTHTT